MSRLNDILKSLRPDKTHRLRVIMLCVFAATTFWILNALNENYSTTLRYPLEFIYDKEEYIAVENLPEDIHVNVSGLGWNLFRSSVGIKVTPVRIVLDEPAEVRKITSATLPGLISDQMNDVQLNYVLTDTLNINIDEKVKRSFLVKVDSANISLEENHRITGKIQSSPDSVTLEGPKKKLTSMSDTFLIQIPKTEIDNAYKEVIPIVTEHNDLIKSEPPTVNVAFDVKEFLRAQQDIPIDTQSFPEDGVAYIKNNAIPVQYLVRKDRQDELSSDDFKVIVDYNAMNKQDSTVVPKLVDYPDHLQEVRLDTASHVRIYFNEE